MLNENLKLLFIIPARFGSKGIPRKNLKILNGKPLIFYSINNASEISCEKEVVVSSDSDEILNIATKFGAKALKRPAELAGDQTTLDPVVFHAYKSLVQILILIMLLYYNHLTIVKCKIIGKCINVYFS